MNNNDWNNSDINKSLNSNYETANSNLSNNFNNINNNQSNLSSVGGINKKNNKSYSIIVGIVIGVIVLGVIIGISVLGNSSLLGSGKNLTGSTEYKGSDVDFNCIYEQLKEDNSMKVYSDFIFNYKSKGSSGGQYNYQLKIYNKMVVDYKNGLADSRYKDFVNSFDSLVCLNPNDCTGNHLELGLTDMGWDTVIDRSGDKIEVTYYNLYGMGLTANEQDMDDIKEQYENNGFVCD